ncbi:MAG: serine hydroxymethyltransferase [Candidatus Eremiobacteraeota bacterium]|nr:serine hydroxymethyltransferase [Candidatus Eremiobacteraeota bacterium]
MFRDLCSFDPDIAQLILKETERQAETVNLIASENFISEAVLGAQGSILSNKYAEGYPHDRYYAGCSYYDEIEKEAIKRACGLFSAEHANLQPHSGSQANMAVYFASLSYGDTIMGMSLNQGGHLTHGSPRNFSGKLYRFVSYSVNRETELIDYEEVRSLAREHRPRLIVAGATVYPREIDFSRFREIADEVGALLMVDMAHIAGLIASGVHMNPCRHADFVSSSTHKTLRGPRGGMILSKASWKKKIDAAVFPGLQGGPLMHVIAAKAVAFKEAATGEFRSYCAQIVKNAKKLASSLQERGFRLVSGGTDNHLMLIDLTSKKVTGIEAQEALQDAGIITNRNCIPFDSLGPKTAGGIRLGTPAITTRGMKEEEMEFIADCIYEVIEKRGDEAAKAAIREKVRELCKGFPLYEEKILAQKVVCEEQGVVTQKKA